MDSFPMRALLALSLSLAAACERPEAPGAPPGARPPEPSRPADAAPEAGAEAEATVECVNRTEGYAVRYPAGWHVNTGEVLGECELFDPDPIRVPRDSEVPIETAVMIDVEPVPFARLSGEVLGRSVLSREATTVDGRQAVRIEGETTGEGLHPPGIRMYEYFVDLGGETMVAVAYEAGDLPFERKRRVLEAMMASVEFRRDH